MPGFFVLLAARNDGQQPESVACEGLISASCSALRALHRRLRGVAESSKAVLAVLSDVQQRTVRCDAAWRPYTLFTLYRRVHLTLKSHRRGSCRQVAQAVVPLPVAMVTCKFSLLLAGDKVNKNDVVLKAQAQPAH